MAGDSALNAWVSEAPGGAEFQGGNVGFLFPVCPFGQFQDPGRQPRSLGLSRPLVPADRLAQHCWAAEPAPAAPLSVHQPQPRPGARALSGLSWNLTRISLSVNLASPSPGHPPPPLQQAAMTSCTELKNKQTNKAKLKREAPRATTVQRLSQEKQVRTRPVFKKEKPFLPAF